MKKFSTAFEFGCGYHPHQNRKLSFCVEMCRFWAMKKA